jgi:glycine C-acetyltransferase
MMVDDAHSSGVLGRGGRGTVDHLACHGRVHIQVGTLSKAIGAMGGYVCGSRELIDFLCHRARPFLYSTGHPPSVVATSQAAFTLLDSPDGEKLIEKLWSNTNFFQRHLKRCGFSIGATQTPITPIHVGEGAKAFEFSRRLYDAGVYTPAVGFPTVPEGKARLRAIVTATHRRADLDRACQIIAHTGHSLGLV